MFLLEAQCHQGQNTLHMEFQNKHLTSHFGPPYCVFTNLFIKLFRDQIKLKTLIFN